MLESSSNHQIRKIKKLKKSARFRRQEQCFVAEGWKMTEEAIQRGLAQAVYVSESAQKEYQDRRADGTWKALDTEIPVEYVSEKLFRELSDTVTPQGILAVVAMPAYKRKDILSGEEAALLCLENIQDPGNLGTMIRTAEGAGMAGVLLSRDCVDLFNPKVVRSTMGALFRVPFYVCNDISTEVEHLKCEGFTFYAAHLKGTTDFTEHSYEGRTGILIGNEAQGLTDQVAELVDWKVKIPMEGELESLNAAVSAALFMYEVHRNRYL